jgi:hypothetical protein
MFKVPILNLIFNNIAGKPELIKSLMKLFEEKKAQREIASTLKVPGENTKKQIEGGGPSCYICQNRACIVVHVCTVVGLCMACYTARYGPGGVLKMCPACGAEHAVMSVSEI